MLTGTGRAVVFPDPDKAVCIRRSAARDLREHEPIEEHDILQSYLREEIYRYTENMKPGRKYYPGAFCIRIFPSIVLSDIPKKGKIVLLIAPMNLHRRNK